MSSRLARDDGSDPFQIWIIPLVPQPRCKTGHGRKCNKVLEVRKLGLQASTTCFINKLPKLTPVSPFCVFDIE